MKLRGMAVLPTAIVAVGSIGASSALAVDIVIEDGQIAGITQTLESVGDTLTVEAGGTVSTVDGAVVMDADSQVLNNRGLIGAADGDAVTINGDGSTVNNDGTIQTYGYAAYGLYSTALSRPSPTRAISSPSASAAMASTRLPATSSSSTTAQLLLSPMKIPMASMPKMPTM